MPEKMELDATFIDKFFVPEEDGLEIGEDSYEDNESLPNNFYEGTIEATDEEEVYED